MSKVTMPEPVAWLIDWPDEPDLGHYFAEEPASNCRSQPLITTAQAESYATAKVREALEEAAQACEARIGTHAPGMTPEDVEDCDEEARLCAGVVRALIPKE